MLKKPSYKQLILSGLLASSILSTQVGIIQADETTPTTKNQNTQLSVTTATPTENNPATTATPVETVTTTNPAPVTTNTVTTADTPTSNPVPVAAPITAPAAVPTPVPAPATSAQPTITIGNQVVPVTFDKPEVAPIVQSNQPDRIVTTLTENPMTEMAFNWFTKDALVGAAVRISETPDMANARVIEAQTLATTNTYAERTKDGNIIFHIQDLYKDKTNVQAYITDATISEDNKAWTSGATYGYEILQEVAETINRAIVTGLNPDTKYYYQVGAAHLLSPVGTFKTAALKESDFKFIHYTDTQNGVWNENVRNEAEFGARTLNEALATAKDANFALHTGDVVEISRVEDEWKDVLNRSQEGYLAVPHVVASGNHDTHKTTLNDHFNIPINNQLHKGAYYSFDYNGAHFTVLNTNDNEVDGDNPTGAALSDTQLAWLETDLARARQKGVNWLVVAYHKPLYSSSYHSLQDPDVQAVRERLISILDKYDVDLVLNGHDHVLTTTKPLVANIDAFADGIVDTTTKKHIDDDGKEYIDTDGTMFVIPNAAGTKLYDDIFNEPLEHIKKVRPKLSFMTQENLRDYRKLFELSSQPGKSPAFKESHSNQRDSQWQNFGVYTVTPDELKIDLYQVEGNVLKTAENVLRDPKLVASYILVNHKFDLADKNQELKEEKTKATSDDDEDKKTNQNQATQLVNNSQKPANQQADDDKDDDQNQPKPTKPQTDRLANLNQKPAGQLTNDDKDDQPSQANQNATANNPGGNLNQDDDRDDKDDDDSDKKVVNTQGQSANLTQDNQNDDDLDDQEDDDKSNLQNKTVSKAGITVALPKTGENSSPLAHLISLIFLLSGLILMAKKAIFNKQSN